jgi:hypothetical protein
VLTVTPAFAVQRVLAPDGAAATISRLRTLLGFSEQVLRCILVCTADPWHQVVIHNVPFRDVQEGPEGSWFRQNSKSIFSDWKEYNPLACCAANQCARASRFLIPKNISDEELMAKGSVSVCVAFNNIKHVHKLIQDGAFVHGTHCRVSLYRPMSRSRV